MAKSACIPIRSNGNSTETPSQTSTSSMARAAIITTLFFSTLSNFLVPSECKQYATHLASSRDPDKYNNIQLVCSATRYPTSCLDALQPDKRAQNAFTPQELVEVLTAIAMEHAQVGVTDARTLATLAITTSNPNLTAVATGCTEILDLAAYHVQRSHAALAGRAVLLEPDIQAWLSGALTQSNDCFYGLGQFRATIAFVEEMTDRGNVTVEMISNALAVVDAGLYYGWDATLWRPPPESREEQLIRLKGTEYAENFIPDWVDDADRGGVFHAELAPNVTVGMNSTMGSIQAAVDQAPSWSSTRYVIYIKAGVYNETVRVPKEKTDLMFLGDGSNVTIITGSLHVQSPGITTWLSATVAVSGAGFIARGVTFENTAGPEQHQAVALRVESDRSAFQACSILGHQDSLYTHSLRQFYKDCTITGTVDFIFGNSAAVFQTCQILVRPREDRVGQSTTSTLTAQGRIDPAQNTALVFQNCSVDGTPEYNALQRADPGLHRVYLGRPWKTYSRTIFIYTYLSLDLQPQGWSAWNGSFALDTLLDAEYGSYGPGGAANMTHRIPWSSQLSLQQAQSFSAQRLLQADTWLPQTTIPYSPLV